MSKSVYLVVGLVFAISGCTGTRNYMDHGGHHNDGHGNSGRSGGGGYERCVIDNMRGQSSDQVLSLVEKECER